VGVTAKEITEALTAGNIAPVLNEAREGYRALKADMDSVSADKFTAESDKAIDALIGINENTDARREKAAAMIEVEAREAEFTGRVAQGWTDEAYAKSLATTEAGKWLDVGRQLAPTLDAQKRAALDATTATEGKTEADAESAAKAELAKVGQERLKQALDEAREATDEAKRATDDYLLGIVDYPGAVDSVTGSVHDLTEQLAEQNEKQIEGAGTFEGNTEAALANRAALRDVTSEAAEAIGMYDDMGLTVAEATQRQNELAASAYNEAIALGAPEAVAARLRDNILGIPPSVTTDVHTTTNALETEKAIDKAARDRETTISVSLQQVGVSQAVWDAVQQQMAGRAEGGIVRARPGGSLQLVGEGGEDEAIVPLGPHFAANLARIVGPRFMGQLDGGRASSSTTTSPTIVVNIANAPADPHEARGLGRLVGETAAEVLAHRQLATSIRIA
jgi:hypothetical protein